MTGRRKFFLIAAVLCVLSCNDALKLALDVKASTTPIAGGGGVLTVSAVTMDGFTVSWTAAQEGVTPSEKMKYLVYTSTTNRVSTVAEAEAYGAPFGTMTENVTSMPITGLVDNMEYWVNVVVQDEAGNKAAYVMTANPTRTAKHSRIYLSNCPSSANMSRADAFSPYTHQTIIPGISGTDGPMGIAVDPVDRKIYWTDYITSAKIRRADFDGGNVEDVITSGLTYPDGIAVDYAASRRYLYWTDSSRNCIYRSSLPPASMDATAYKILDNGTDGVSGPEGIDVDIATGEFYWAENGTAKRIRKAPAVSPSGNISNLVFAGLTNPWDVAVDWVNHIYYWTDYGSNKIQAHGLVGGTYDVINQNIYSPEGITIDVDSSELYWIDWGPAGNGRVFGASSQTTDPDGSHHVIISGQGTPTGIQIY